MADQAARRAAIKDASEVVRSGSSAFVRRAGERPMSINPYNPHSTLVLAEAMYRASLSEPWGERADWPCEGWGYWLNRAQRVQRLVGEIHGDYPQRDKETLGALVEWHEVAVASDDQRAGG